MEEGRLEMRSRRSRDSMGSSDTHSVRFRTVVPRIAEVFGQAFATRACTDMPPSVGSGLFMSVDPSGITDQSR